MKKGFWLALVASVLFLNTYATHLRCGEIRVKQLDGLTVRITIAIYTNTINTNVLVGGEDDWLNFGDGITMLIPEQLGVLQPSMGSGIATTTVTVTHTYAAPGQYLISFSEPNRNEGILNMDWSINTRFYIETFINLKPGSKYQTPDFLLPPVHVAFAGSTLSRSLACMDSVGNYLVYDVVSPKRERNTDVFNYKLPENFSINKYNGLITWDTKFKGAYTAGEYQFAVKVSQYDTNGTIVGYIVRDFQVILNDGPSTPEISDNADLDENNRIYTGENSAFALKVMMGTANTNNMVLSAHSELSQNENAFHFSTYDSTTATGTRLKVGKLRLTNTDAIRRDFPYVIAIRCRFELPSFNEVLSKELSYLFYTKDLQPGIPKPPVVEPPVVVGVETGSFTAFNIFPNPARDFIYFQTSGSTRFELWDITGKRRQHGIADEDHPLDIRHLSPGLYLLITNLGNNRSALKVMKE